MSATLTTHATPKSARRPAIPNALLGMLIFIACEVMFFAGLISAFTIVRSSALPGMWPPPDQPRLPAASTAFNTTALLLSGLFLLVAHRRQAKSPQDTKKLFLLAWLLGTVFVALQGVEWLALLQQGLTLTSSPLGAFFYLIVGAHALHAVAALAALGVAGMRLWQGTLQPSFFATVLAFWWFVVGLWPLIYLRVYF